MLGYIFARKNNRCTGFNYRLRNKPGMATALLYRIITKMKRILIVDDEEGVLMAFKRLFKGPGIVIDTAGDMPGAMEFLNKNDYQVIITDLSLQGGDSQEGLKLLSLIKSRCRGTKMIMMTAYGNDAVRREAMSLGVDYYFEKPVDSAVLKCALSNLGVG